MAKGRDEVTSNVGLPRELRQRVDELRLARARRSNGRPPALKALIVEALEALVRRSPGARSR